MCKKLASLVLSSAMVLFSCGNCLAGASREEKSAKLAEKIKTVITKIGTGPAARVEVKLRDKTKLKGYVDQIAADHFVVVDDKTGTAVTVAYPQVKQVKGNNLSTGAKTERVNDFETIGRSNLV